MYQKKYLTLGGDRAGTVKLETRDEKTHVHIRLSSPADEILRAYLSHRGGARAYGGIISENGELVFDARGVFDAVYLTAKEKDEEKICAFAFSDGEYDIAPASKGNGGVAAEGGVKQTAAPDAQEKNIVFHIASEAENDAPELKNNDVPADDAACDEWTRALEALVLIILYLESQTEAD